MDFKKTKIGVKTTVGNKSKEINILVKVVSTATLNAGSRVLSLGCKSSV